MLLYVILNRVSARLAAGDGPNGVKPKRRRLSTLLEKEQEEASERRKLDEQKVELDKEELQLRHDGLAEQRRQHELIREQMQQQAAQTESILKLLAKAISQKGK